MTRSYRCYTAAEIEALTAAADESRALGAEVRQAMAEVGALIEARTGGNDFWMHHAEFYGLAPLAEVWDATYSTPGASSSLVLPQVGHVWHARFNPATWQATNRRTRRELAALRRALVACAQLERQPSVLA